MTAVTEGYTIGRAARIGLHCTIAPGVIVGENSMIGMHSLVTRDIPRRELWYGAPASKHGDTKPEHWL